MRSALVDWICIPVSVGILAKLIGTLVLLAFYHLLPAEVGKAALIDDSYSVAARSVGRNMLLYVVIILFVSPLVENGLVVLASEWLRSTRLRVTVASAIAGMAAFGIHGADVAASAPAAAFAVYALYYIWARHTGSGMGGAYFKTVLAHTVSNGIALLVQSL